MVAQSAQVIKRIVNRPGLGPTGATTSSSAIRPWFVRKHRRLPGTNSSTGMMLRGRAASAATHCERVRFDGPRIVSAAPHAALQRSAAPLIRAASALVGDDDALDAARLFTAWATGFLQMELSGAFRLGGDVDRAFDYGLRRLIAGLTA